MAVSKRLRYEILRRDEFKCRYCHKADVELTVDHVVPVALGGTNDPSNLAAACKSCNSGKTSTTPGAPLVAQVRDDAMRWQVAWNAAVAEAELDGQERNAAIAAVRQNYVAAYTARHRSAPILRDDTDASIGRWIDLGLPLTLIDKAISAAIGRDRIRPEGRFAYFAGCCWSLLRELQERTGQIVKESLPISDEADEADETTLVERIAKAFRHGWDYTFDAPDAHCWRILAAHTTAASAAGYSETTIESAAFSAAYERNANLGDYLHTLDSVLENEADVDPDGLYGSMGIDVDLLPSQKDRDADAVTNAATAVWRAAWRDNIGDPPGKRSAACAEFRSWARDAYLSSEDAVEVLEGAEWAGAEGSTDLPAATAAFEAHRATEPAVSVWETSWKLARGTRPPASVHNAFWKDCYALHANGISDHQIIVAAAFAGTHATTRMHFGLGDGMAEVIGVFAPAQRIEDAWARTWKATHDRWPTEGDRADLRAELFAIADGEAHNVGDVSAAAVAAATYQSTDLTPFLPRSLSVFESAAHLPQVGGA